MVIGIIKRWDHCSVTIISPCVSRELLWKKLSLKLKQQLEKIVLYIEPQNGALGSVTTAW